MTNTVDVEFKVILTFTIPMNADDEGTVDRDEYDKKFQLLVDEIDELIEDKLQGDILDQEWK